MDAYAHHAPAAHDPEEPHPHTVPLWGLFLALLALTAAEVALFEVWHRTQQHDLAGNITWQLMPKFVMVLVLLVFTIPKAALVMIFFMHLKFERQLIVLLALIPFVTAAIGILIPTADNQTLQHQQKMTNFVPALKTFAPNDNEEGHSAPEHAAPTVGKE